MVGRWLIVASLAMVSMLVAGCSVIDAFQEIRDLETTLKDKGYNNAKINLSYETKNDVTKIKITAAVDRPRNPAFDQKLGTEVADLVIMNYTNIKDLDTITVELNGSGPGTKQTRTPSEWRDLARDFRQPAGVNSAELAKNVRGDNFETIDPTTDFPADQKIYHAVLVVRNLPPDTTVKAVWTAIDTKGVAEPNQVIVETEVKAVGSQRLHFTMEPNAGQLPPGKYKLDVSWAGKVERTLPFTVAGG